MDLETLLTNPNYSKYNLDIELFKQNATRKLEDYSFQLRIGNYITAQRLLDEFLELQLQISILQEYLASQLPCPINPSKDV